MKLWRVLNVVTILMIVLLLGSCADETSPKLAPLTKDAIILAFGDSLTYGSGSDSKTQSYPVILSKLTGLKVINAGIPGEISQLGLERLPDVLDQVQPNLVILCHGGNDLIRKLGQQQLKNNLDKMIALIRGSGAEVVLIGVPSFSFTLAVPDLYGELAQSHNIPIELEVLPQLERNPKVKSDHIHPNAAGYELFAEAISRLLRTSGLLD